MQVKQLKKPKQSPSPAAMEQVNDEKKNTTSDNGSLRYQLIRAAIFLVVFLVLHQLVHRFVMVPLLVPKAAGTSRNILDRICPPGVECNFGDVAI